VCSQAERAPDGEPRGRHLSRCSDEYRSTSAGPPTLPAPGPGGGVRSSPPRMVPTCATSLCTHSTVARRLIGVRLSRAAWPPDRAPLAVTRSAAFEGAIVLSLPSRSGAAGTGSARASRQGRPLAASRASHMSFPATGSQNRVHSVECNCGIEASLDGRRLDRIRGTRRTPGTHGYTCNKAMSGWTLPERSAPPDPLAAGGPSPTDLL